MKDVARWLQQRELSYSTNEVDGAAKLLVVFGDKPGGEQACVCTITASPEQGLVTISSVFMPAVKTGRVGLAIGLVVAANTDSQWGAYGINTENRQLSFRISLFRPDGRVKPDEMDRLLSETITASSLVGEFLSNGDETDYLPSGPATDSNPSRRVFQILKAGGNSFFRLRHSPTDKCVEAE